MKEYPYSQTVVHNLAVTSLELFSDLALFSGFQDGKIKFVKVRDSVISVYQTYSLVSKKINSINTKANDFLVSSGNQIIHYDYLKEVILRRVVDERLWVNNTSAKYLTDDTVAAVDNDNSMKIFDIRSGGRPVQVYRHAKDSFNCMDFVALRNWVISCGSNDGSMYTYDLRQATVTVDDLSKVYKDDTAVSPVMSITLSESASPSFAVVGILTQGTYLVDLNFGQSHNSNFVKDYNEHEISDNVVEFTARELGDKTEQFYKVDAKLISDSHVICGSETGEVTIYGTKTQSEVRLKTFNSYRTTENSASKLLANVCYLKTSDTVMAGSADGKLHLWQKVHV